MSSKTYKLDQIGLISVYKRRGAKRVNLRVSSKLVKVTQPLWLPYSTGLQFAIKNHQWIAEQRQRLPIFTINDGMRVGKLHTIKVYESETLRTRVTNDKIKLYIPKNMDINGDEVIERAKVTIKRALKSEAKNILGPRLLSIANQYGFTFKNSKFKSMKSRWGSCNSQKSITLNIYLLLMPWELIDYVIIHELTHTNHLHHGKSFWAAMGETMPDYKNRRIKLKSIQQSIYNFQ